MKQRMELDRRRFLQLAGSACLLSMADGPVAWSAERAAPARFAYIGAEHAIHQYSISENGRFVLQQTMASARPVAMAISGGYLYVANGVSQHGNLPRGSVEAYTINATNGQLALKNRVPLSLSATSPADLAVAPNGRSIVVAVHGGGAYNLLLLEEDGSLGRVTGILKEIGAGPHALQDAAHPSAVKFDRVGRVLTADQGNDKLSVLTLSDGGLLVAGRCEVTPGSGPGYLALHPDGRRVYVGHALDGAVSSYSYDAAGILEHKQTVGTSVMGAVAALAIHPSGEMLFSAHGNALLAWKLQANGGLAPLPGLEKVHATRLHVTGDGGTLLALSSDAVWSMKINAAAGLLATPVKVASLSKSLSLAIS
ncbi:MAG TPA: beta-propeller fold lactonase family protein [Acidobacteriaceae bacterium]|nr:beta-propeller fold lactonase family protein [Acidobacteriaceae bacterium]